MLFFLLSLTLALAQENEDGLENIQEHNEELKLKELMEEKLKKERDTVYYTCIILSRLHIGNYGDELLSIVKKYIQYIFINQLRISRRLIKCLEENVFITCKSMCIIIKL